MSHHSPVSRVGGPRAQLLITQQDARHQQITLRRYTEWGRGIQAFAVPSAAVLSTGPDVAQQHRAAEKVNCRPLEHPVGSLAVSDMQES
jgi:hypothetical protein